MNEVTSTSRVVTHTSIYYRIIVNQETGAINWTEKNEFADIPMDEVLQPGTDQRPYSVFEVVEPINVKSGSIASWFDEPGGGIQYLLPDTVDELLDAGILRRIQ